MRGPDFPRGNGSYCDVNTRDKKEKMFRVEGEPLDVSEGCCKFFLHTGLISGFYPGNTARTKLTPPKKTQPYTI